MPGHLRTMKVCVPKRLMCYLDVVLQDPHRRHGDDDRKHAHQHPEQSQGRPQLVRRQRAHRHEKTLAQLGKKADGPFACHLHLLP